MATIVELIKRLREETGAGVSACRMALETANGSYELALRLLREQAEAEAAKREARETPQGRVELYAHGDGRLGVMVEVGTETDFAARSEVVRKLAHEVALQVAATSPSWVRDEEIPAEALEAEMEKARQRAQDAGKGEALAPKIVEGMLNRWKDEQVLLRQVYIRDEGRTVGQLVSQAAAAVGEKVVVRRFVRWEIEGEG